MDRKQASEYQEQDPSVFTPPNSSSLTLVPFIPDGNGWILSDGFLLNVYERLLEERLMRVVFWDDSMRSGEDFIAFCKNQHNILTFVFDEQDCAGFAWLAGVSGNYAFGHFCFFHSVWGTKTDEIASKYVNYWLSFPGSNGPLLDTIIGAVPGFNKHAHGFVERAGFNRLGVVPSMFKNRRGEREDAVIFYLSRFTHGREK